MKIYKLGNSEGIQMEFRGNSGGIPMQQKGIQGEFRGNSDAKKGIRIKCNENIVRFAMIFDTEVTPSYPFIILKGRMSGIFDENH